MTDVNEEEHVDERKLEDIYNGLSLQIVMDTLAEKAAKRRWVTFRRVLLGTSLVLAMVIYAGSLAGGLGYRTMPGSDSVAVIPVTGTIAPGGEASAESVIIVLEKMFKSKKVKGIVLLINSGGGSPTEAERISNYIDDKEKETGKRVIAVCGTMCASAAYLIAAHTDAIYAGEYSWSGSIGAIMKGWDMQGVLNKAHVAQRVFASGPLKDLMNPYAPLTEQVEEKLESLVNNTANVFVSDIKQLRGEKLAADRDLFTGEVWLGSESMELGLIDGIGTVEEVVSEEFDGLPMRTYRPKRQGNTLFDKILGDIGAGIVRALMEQDRQVVM